jgi:rhamnopyranosyl-N-acetylglucosaminyl-diphospho-decaprenol beta-1,3/1,4-galactofuranosyltransferase
MNTKIAAVVVTYNRKVLLKECLEGILKQTRAVDKIFIIDNNSNDGTESFIQETYGNNPLISYTNMHDNTGASGGFYEGIKQAFEYGADWIWTMDDDVEPKQNALEVQLSYGHISECIHPRKTYLDGTYFVWEGLLDFTAAKPFYHNGDVSFDNGKDFFFTNIACFEGMLISRRVVEKIGYPDTRFFLNHDDLEYGFRASLWINIICIKDVLFTRKIGSGNSTAPISNNLLYYSTRNRFLIAKHLKEQGILNARQWNVAVVIMIVRGIYNKLFVEGSFKRLQVFLKAIWHGLTEKWGRVESL